MKTCFQTSCISSAMFITAMAANPLAVNLASEALGQPISWGAWALAGIVPGLICLAAAPLILYVLYPPGKPLLRGWLQASATAYSIQGCLRVHAVGNVIMMLCCCIYAYQSIQDVNRLGLGLGQLLPAFHYDHQPADWTEYGYTVYMGSVQCLLCCLFCLMWRCTLNQHLHFSLILCLVQFSHIMSIAIVQSVQR